MLKRVLVATVVLSALALSGCLFIPAPPTGVVEGYVTDHLSGEPVKGAMVRAWSGAYPVSFHPLPVQ